MSDMNNRMGNIIALTIEFKEFNEHLDWFSVCMGAYEYLQPDVDILPESKADELYNVVRRSVSLLSRGE